MLGYSALPVVPDGTLTRYIKTQDELHQGDFYTNMPVYSNKKITTKLNREKTRFFTSYHEIYFSFSEFLEKLCNPNSSRSWIIAGLLSDSGMNPFMGLNKLKISDTVTKQILFKRIDDHRIAAIINIIDSKKLGLNNKYSNKIIFFQCPIGAVYVYDVNFDDGKINLVNPHPKFGNAITDINDPISSNVVYIADPNNVNEKTIVDWFGGKSIQDINAVIDTIIKTIKPSLTEIQDNHDLQAKLEKLDAQPQLTQADVGGGKRRTKNNNYAITPKITRVYKNKRYHSKRNRRVSLKRNVITSSKRQSRKHSRTSRRK
jgi:hypothetical protein